MEELATRLQFYEDMAPQPDCVSCPKGMEEYRQRGTEGQDMVQHNVVALLPLPQIGQGGYRGFPFQKEKEALAAVAGPLRDTIVNTARDLYEYGKRNQQESKKHPMAFVVAHIFSRSFLMTNLLTDNSQHNGLCRRYPAFKRFWKRAFQREFPEFMAQYSYRRGELIKGAKRRGTKLSVKQSSRRRGRLLSKT